MYFPPYSPDLNPIEEFFAELKTFIKGNWQTSEDSLEGFGESLERCVNVVGGREGSSKGRFRHAGLAIEEL
jgi:transposase